MERRKKVGEKTRREIISIERAVRGKVSGITR